MQSKSMFLAICLEPKKVNEIQHELGWTSGGTASVLIKLVNEKLLTKTKGGLYLTSSEGFTVLQNIVEEDEYEEYTKIDKMVTLILACRTNNRVFLFDTFKSEHDILKKSKQLDLIHQEIRRIYEESIDDSLPPHRHRNEQLTIGMWSSHEYVNRKCTEHQFDYEKSFNEYAFHTKNMFSREGLFEFLHFFSLPVAMRLKKHVNTTDRKSFYLRYLLDEENKIKRSF